MKEKVNLESVFNRILDDNPDLDISSDEFEDKVKQSLKDGRFNLIIISYSIDDTIIEVMDYLRTYGMRIKGFEFRYFENDEKEYFVTRWIDEENNKTT